ncbi:hypothetical protein F0562_000207 [Nyssa sinensis]|uniref:Uncharacterized protein n=1 Tax=Nyssa sinensis TaxID=561372 RepID=A0A5J5C0U4_9ASTE|nr:hypothetical protein F0562_000207 [Nyssa sinensis]
MEKANSTRLINRTDKLSLGDDEEESGRDPDGESAEPGRREIISSGFGGLGFDGMVGMEEDPAGEDTRPPGEGKRGAMSGDNSVNGDKDSEDEAMKAIMSAPRNQKEAIQMMMKSIKLLGEFMIEAIKRYDQGFVIIGHRRWGKETKISR